MRFLSIVEGGVEDAIPGVVMAGISGKLTEETADTGKPAEVGNGEFD